MTRTDALPRRCTGEIQMTTDDAEAKPRRPKGSLSYRQLASGKIECRTTHGGKAISRTGVNKSEAAGRVRDAIRQMERGAVNPSRETVRQFAARWLVDARPRLEWNTYRRYEQDLRLHILPALGKLGIADITVRHVQNLLTDAGQIYKPATVAKFRGVLVALLEDAQRDGLIAQNVARLARNPKQTRVEVKPFTVEQARSFLTVVRGDRLEAFFTVGIAVGMRQGEILGLLWRNVDLDTGRVVVETQLQRERGRFVIKDVKTRTGRRVVILPVFARDALQRHKERQDRERAEAGIFWEEWGLVFTAEYGAPIHSQIPRRLFHTFCLAANVPDLTFHDTRHTSASLLAAEGVPVRQIMDLLGHSTAAMSNYYSHVYDAGREEMARVMEETLNPPAKVTPLRRTQKPHAEEG